MGHVRAKRAFKALAPALTDAVRVVIYACSTAGGASGGKQSFAAKLRDQLASQGKSRGSVWGHTTTGRVSKNINKRFLAVSQGAGSPGVMYTRHVFNSAWEAGSLATVRTSLEAQGYVIPGERTARFEVKSAGVVYGVGVILRLGSG